MNINAEIVEQMSGAKLQDQRAVALADLVVAALIDEATLTPKPGLVDLSGRGAHTDLSWSLMCDSALALRGTFEAMAAAGMTIADPLQLRQTIGRLGRIGEQTMMTCTGGVNTHRGAIWALGLLVTAAAQDALDASPVSVADRAARLANIHDRYAPAVTGNKGELACKIYQVGGARLQAAGGFPLVLQAALPQLQRARQRGASESAARLNALLAVMAQLDDTCVLSRGGLHALQVVQSGAQLVLDLGGSDSQAGGAAYKVLELTLLDMQVSPGGAADLLAAALFLERLNRRGA
ncbi:triphosphoribosyl-dephospho-CoA synthase [Oxalobacteraceae bacterium GrIS 2.11]